jgi:hypothetical protein
MNIQLFEFIKEALTTAVATPVVQPVIEVAKAPTWISANMSAVLTLAGSTLAGIFSAVAMYLSNKNHNLVTQIHVDTNGRLSAMTAELLELKQAAITATAVAAATKIGTDKAASVASDAADHAASLLLQAQPASSSEGTIK